MDGGGFILLHRRLFDHPIWNDKPFNQGAAWVDLIGLAAYKDRRVFSKGIGHTVKRGQVLASYRHLAKRWGWSPNRVARFLDLLVAEGMCELETEHPAEHLGTLVTLSNYDTWQATAEEVRNSLRNSSETGAEQERDRSETNKKESKQVNKGNNTPSAPAVAGAAEDPAGGKPKRKRKAKAEGDGLDESWAAFRAIYPDRAGGHRWAEARIRYRARVKEGWPPEVIQAAAMRYAVFCERMGRTGTEYVMAATTFFGREHEENFTNQWRASERGKHGGPDGAPRGTGGVSGEAGAASSGQPGKWDHRIYRSGSPEGGGDEAQRRAG